MNLIIVLPKPTVFLTVELQTRIFVTYVYFRGQTLACPLNNCRANVAVCTFLQASTTPWVAANTHAQKRLSRKFVCVHEVTINH